LIFVHIDRKRRISPAQSRVGIAQGLFAPSQLFGPVSVLSARGHNSATGAVRDREVDQAKADAAFARATVACLVFLNRLWSVNSAQLAAATLPCRWPSSPLRR
jgi:hypothetical protein